MREFVLYSQHVGQEGCETCVWESEQVGVSISRWSPGLNGGQLSLTPVLWDTVCVLPQGLPVRAKHVPQLPLLFSPSEAEYHFWWRTRTVILCMEVSARNTNEVFSAWHWSCMSITVLWEKLQLNVLDYKLLGTTLEVKTRSLTSIKSIKPSWEFSSGKKKKNNNNNI